MPKYYGIKLTIE